MTTTLVRLQLIVLISVIILSQTARAGTRTPLADSLFASGQLSVAQELYREAWKSAPDDSHLNRRLGELALYANRLDEARQHLSAAQRVNPDDSVTGRLLAETYYRRDRFDSAAIWMRQFGRPAVAVKLAAFADRTPYRMPDASDVTRVPFVQTDPLPTILIAVNGGEPALFILDTGAHEMVLDPGFAAQAGIVPLGVTQGVFAGGRAAEVGHGIADSVRLENLVVRNVPVGLLSTKRFSAVTGGAPVSGVLGTAFLYHFLSTIDYPNGELVLRTRGSDSALSWTSQVATSAASDRFWLVGTHFLLAPGFLNDADTIMMFMDTGLAGASFSGPDQTFAVAGIVADTGNAMEGVGGGGTVRIVPVTIDRITLGSVTQTDQPGIMGVFPNVVERQFGIHVGGIISHGFFRPYALTLDFDGMRYYLSQ